MKGKYDLLQKFKEIGFEKFYISEITLAELKFGVQNSQAVEKNAQVLAHFLEDIQIIPIINALDIYASEKARLRKAGLPISDFDLLIGSTAVANDMIVVTNNIREFGRITGIQLEDWTNG